MNTEQMRSIKLMPKNMLSKNNRGNESRDDRQA